MSPPETSTLDEYLEHPAEVFTYYESQSVEKVICEEKHMGSRAIVVVCKDAEAAKERFGVTDGKIGVCYTRTGRPFFSDEQLESQFISRVCKVISNSSLWQELETQWICLDCELMPWSVKAQELLKTQYAAVGAASQSALKEATVVLRAGLANDLDLEDTLKRFEAKHEMASQFVRAYRQYCWKVNTIEDLKVAPFHILASEGHVHIDKNHIWHMETISKLCEADLGLFRKTATLAVDLNDDASVQAAIDWWLEMTSKGGEGMVVKPIDFICKGRKGIIQPAIKSRGREYLRIIYGLDYTVDENLARLRKRGLSTKRSLALREFALGIEGLERFVAREPLRRIHQCVFGVLALESESVDPRL